MKNYLARVRCTSKRFTIKYVWLRRAAATFHPNLNGEIELLELAAQNNDRAEIIKILKKLIPEYKPYHHVG